MDLYFDRDKETQEEFRRRVYEMKESLGWTWQDVADLINSETNNDYTESKYRKEFKKLSYEEPEEEPVDELLELQKERVKIRDERVQTNAWIRKLAREDTIKEIAIEAAKEIAEKKSLIPPSLLVRRNDEEKEGILIISDWHYGIEVENFLNVYNTNVARQRVSNLQYEVFKIVEKERLDKIHVVDLSDLIAGRIHLQIRLQSRIDVITQIMEVSEILAEFLSNLSQMVRVDYHSCLDNHSRVEPSKTDSLDLESLQRITPWYLKTRLKNYTDIEILDNTYGEDIISFTCMGHSVAGVHGDKDKPERVVEGLTLMTKNRFDLILTAHRHHPYMEEKNETLVVSNGSLMGTDSYARDLRLSSRPSQTMIIVSRENVCDNLYIIKVD